NFRLCAAKRLLLKGDGESVPLMPKAFDTLLYLVEHNGKVIEKDELMSAIWADTIVEENNLTQNISILRRVLGEKHGENRFIATVPGHGYKFVAEVRRLDTAKKSEPPVLAGWSNPAESQIANLTFQNQQSETNNRQQTIDTKPSRWWLIALAMAAIAGLSFLGFSFWRGDTEPVADAPVKTVAVLPFKSLVAEKRDEALELGMADTLISKLSGGEEIVVRPFSAIRRYGSLEQDLLTAGRELGVEAVLDGSIQTSGERIRVSAKLLRTSDGKQLWTGQFDEKFTDIFAVQDSISERVAAALKIRLKSREKKRSTENVEAYQLYMKGRHHALNLTRTETDKGIAYFQQAIEIDPNYALAYVGLAQTYLPMALTSGVPSWEVMPKAKAAALRAVELDETLAESHATLGLIMFWYDWDWQAAEKQYLRALELNPNSAEAHFGYAHLLSNVGRHEQALAEIKLSRELDPVALRVNALEGQFLFFAGKHDEALDRLNKTIDLAPNFWLSYLFISRVYTEKGMHAEAVAAAKKAGEITGNSQWEAYRAYALARWGKLKEARAVLKELLDLSVEHYVPPYNIALVYHGLGEREETLAWLEKGYEQRDVRMVFLKVEPKWNNLRDDSRFQELLRRVGFPP
ncbi:MAG: winged helix-turn-helix domain-containing protein, partial [Acidobacteriota bacterium]|nr:winged helix-turn-helix domain-containing protein [Acidobacteriota bacterium]